MFQNGAHKASRCMFLLVLVAIGCSVVVAGMLHSVEECEHTNTTSRRPTINNAWSRPRFFLEYKLM